MKENEQMLTMNTLWQWWLERYRGERRRKDEGGIKFDHLRSIAKLYDEFMAIGKEGVFLWRYPTGQSGSMTAHDIMKINTDGVFWRAHEREDGDMSSETKWEW
jgi:hypothetical protein